MKKYFFILIAVVLGFTACNDSEKSECTTCKTTPPAESRALFSSSSSDIFDLYLKDKTGKLKNDFHMAFHFYNPEDNAVPQYFKKLNILQPISDGEMNNLVLYYKGGLANDEYLDDKEIEAILLYYRLDNNLYVKGYRVLDNKSLVELPEITAYVTAVSTNDYISFANYLGLNTHKYSIISLRNKVKLEKKNYIFLTEKIQRLSKNKKAPDVGSGNSGCSSPCWEIPSEVCMSNYDYTFSCYTPGDGKICPDDENETVVENGGHSYTYNNSVLYDVRNFLAQSPLGQAYIDDYYYIGSIMASEGISLDIALDGMNLGINTLNPILTDFITNNNSASILYNQAEADEIIDFLIDFKDISNDSNFNQIIDNVISLVSLNVNKSNAQIAAIFD